MSSIFERIVARGVNAQGVIRPRPRVAYEAAPSALVRDLADGASDAFATRTLNRERDQRPITSRSDPHDPVSPAPLPRVAASNQAEPISPSSSSSSAASQAPASREARALPRRGSVDRDAGSDVEPEPAAMRLAVSTRIADRDASNVDAEAVIALARPAEPRVHRTVTRDRPSESLGATSTAPVPAPPPLEAESPHAEPPPGNRVPAIAPRAAQTSPAAAPRASDRRSHRAEASTEPPVIHVRIGRIDVRAVVETPPAPPPRRPARPRLGLEEYLRQRIRGER